MIPALYLLWITLYRVTGITFNASAQCYGDSTLHSALVSQGLSPEAEKEPLPYCLWQEGNGSLTGVDYIQHCNAIRQWRFDSGALP
ncbi:hypothetical protein BJ956_003087 [Arthrobacter psychrochitiniphilus]|nr:hypothetical protein [Arthrobacter psychrochitiniphilus]